ncbi:hypothetical protein P9112_002748 [Eukaryota sp. TZLM1-RC]
MDHQNGEPQHFDRSVTSTLGSYFINRDSAHFAQSLNAGTLVFVYQPGYLISDLVELSEGHHVYCFIDRQYLTPSNPNVLYHQLWGSDVYTADSDLVAVLVHLGYLKLRKTVPCDLHGVLVGLSIHGPLPEFHGTTRNNIQSRSISDTFLIAFKVEGLNFQYKPHCEVTYTVPKLTIMWSLSNDPCYKFDLKSFLDDPLISFSRKLESAVLYLEDMNSRYEVSFFPSPTDPGHHFAPGKIMFSKVGKPFEWPMERLIRASMQKRLPLGLNGEAEVLKELYLADLSWNFSSNGSSGFVFVGNFEVPVDKYFWVEVENNLPN